jgi:hypothetical protein
MSSSKAFEIAVMREMRECGVLNQLNASFLSRSADAIQGSEFDSLKPYKTLRGSVDDKIAAALVLRYLRAHHLQQTLNCVDAETQSTLPVATEAEIREVGIGKTGGLPQLWNYWEGHRDEIRDRNEAELRDVITTRLEGIRSSPSPRRSPRPA